MLLVLFLLCLHKCYNACLLSMHFKIIHIMHARRWYLLQLFFIMQLCWKSITTPHIRECWHKIYHISLVESNIWLTYGPTLLITGGPGILLFNGSMPLPAKKKQCRMQLCYKLVIVFYIAFASHNSDVIYYSAINWG